jgi:cold shock CspA family protein
MIGRIKNLSATNRSGFIQAENGQTVYFAGSAVWEHDFPLLTVGQAVSFELQGDHWPKAANVHLLEDRHPSRAQEKAQEAIQFRYVGFEQSGSVRTFRFQGVVSGALTRDYSVTGDVRLFQKYRVGIQEGPALCVRLLLAQVEVTHEPSPSTRDTALTDKDFATLVASRVVAPRKPFRRRPVRPQVQRADHPV